MANLNQRRMARLRAKCYTKGVEIPENASPEERERLSAKQSRRDKQTSAAKAQIERLEAIRKESIRINTTP